MRTTIEQPKLRTKGPTPSPRPAFIRRHAVAIYYAIAFAISWGAILLAVGPDGFIGTADTIAIAGAVSLAGPSVAGILMTGLVDGRAGFRELVSRLLRWRVRVRWYAVALLTAPLVMAATQFGLSLKFPEFRPDILTADDKLSIVMIGTMTALVVPVFEELGWTGFVLPRLRRRYGVLVTGLLMGLLWGAWHLPLFAGTTDSEGTVPPALVVGALLLAWLPAYRVLMVWVYERTASLLLTMLMHAPIVVAQYVLAAEAVSGTAVLTQVLLWGAVFWLIVAVVAWTNGGRLTPREDAAARERRSV